MRGLAAAIARTSATPSAVSQTGRISVAPAARPRECSWREIASSSARIASPLDAIG